MTRDPASSTERWDNILIALDGSEESTAILEYSRPLLERASAALTFLRVIECSESRFGDPATEILREIVDGAPDVAILNWHGRPWLGRPVGESVANRVLLSSPIAILYFPAFASQESVPGPHPLRLRQVLVLLDGSSEAEEILPGAERMARTLDAGLHLFQAVAPGGDEPARRREADRYLGEVARGLSSRGIDCHLQIRTGTVLESVLHLLGEGEFDAVAIATRGRSGWAQALFGSLTKELLRGAHVPILTVCMRDHRRPIPVSGQRAPLRVI